jgi:hypothetical protein
MLPTDPVECLGGGQGAALDVHDERLLLQRHGRARATQRLPPGDSLSALARSLDDKPASLGLVDYEKS